MKTAIYIRTSKIDQNPDNQKLKLIRYCQAMDLEYEIFEEQESTRKTRPVKNKVFQAALRRDFDKILVWKLDRWARSLRELINDLERLRANKVEFQSLNDSIQLNDNPSNMLMIHILGAFAEFERAIIKERTMAGIERARAAGKKLGRPRKTK